MWESLIPIAGALLGGASNSGGGSQTTTANKEPWAPAQAWLKNNLGLGENLQQQYLKNPLSDFQKQAYGNSAALSNSARNTNNSLIQQMNRPQGYTRGNPQARPQAYNFGMGAPITENRGAPNAMNSTVDASRYVPPPPPKADFKFSNGGMSGGAGGNGGNGGGSLNNIFGGMSSGSNPGWATTNAGLDNAKWMVDNSGLSEANKAKLASALGLHSNGQTLSGLDKVGYSQPAGAPSLGYSPMGGIDPATAAQARAAQAQQAAAAAAAKAKADDVAAFNALFGIGSGATSGGSGMSSLGPTQNAGMSVRDQYASYGSGRGGY